MLESSSGTESDNGRDVLKDDTLDDGVRDRITSGFRDRTPDTSVGTGVFHCEHPA